MSSEDLKESLQSLKSLLALMGSEELDSLEIKTAQEHIVLKRPSVCVERTETPLPYDLPSKKVLHKEAPTSKLGTPPAGKPILAPLSGVFYRASSPSSAAFVKEGDIAEVGKTMCIVEAMKVMNEIKAEFRCRIVRIAAENARPINANQPLFFVESLE